MLLHGPLAGDVRYPALSTESRVWAKEERWLGRWGNAYECTYRQG